MTFVAIVDEDKILQHFQHYCWSMKSALIRDISFERESNLYIAIIGLLSFDATK